MTARAYRAATVVVLAGSLISGCTAPARTEPRADPAAALAHVHDLAVDAEGRIVVATHDGIYRLSADQSDDAVGPLGGARFDAMSMATIGETTFASGHPSSDSPASFRSPNVGLMRTTGDTDDWANTSLGGRTDFHALTASRVDATLLLYGIDAADGTLLSSQDSGTTWTRGATLDATDLVVLPGKPDTIYGAARAGVAISTDGGRTFTTDASAPILNLLDIAAEGTIYGIGPDGHLWQKTDTWARGDVLPGTPQALTIAGDRVILATDRGIFATDDLGVQWRPIWLARDARPRREHSHRH